MAGTGTTRRRVLMTAGAAAAALPVTACTTESPVPGRASGGLAGTARAESVLRLRAANISRALLGRYDAVLSRHPAHQARLAPLRAAVALHVTALSAERGAPEPGVSPAPSARVTAAGPGSWTVATDPAQALRDLAEAERRTTAEHSEALMDAPPELARLLASLAAAAAAHAYLLTEGSRS